MCSQLASSWGEWTQLRPDIAVRQVDVDGPDGWVDSPVTKQYDLHSIPAFRVYGPTGRVLLDGRAAYDDVLKTLQKDME